MKSTLIKCGWLVTLDPAIGEMKDGELLIVGNTIKAAGRNLKATADETIDAADKIVMPGLVNAHMHTWETALRGIGAEWMSADYFKHVHSNLATRYQPEDNYIANYMGALAQIDAGVTTLVDWCHNNPTPAHSDAAVQGLADAGIRALFLHGSPKPDPKPGQKHFSEMPMPRGEVERFCKGRFAGRNGLLTFGLAMLGPYYSTYEVTKQDLALAREFDLFASMHVGGGKGMVPDGFERLLDDGLVDRHLTIVHGNDIAPDTVRRIADRGGTFTVTAEIELQMGYGDPLTGILHEHKAPISIGTDVEPAVGSDLFTCMRLTLQHERNRGIIETLEKTGSRPQHSAVTCRDALAWVTTDAAKIAGLDDRVGSVTPGKQADIVLLRTDALNMTPMRDLVGCAVMQAATANVDTVLIAGRTVKQAGRLLADDLAGKLAKLQSSGDRILADFEALPTRAA